MSWGGMPATKTSPVVCGTESRPLGWLRSSRQGAFPMSKLAPWTFVEMSSDIPEFSEPFTVVAYTPQDRLDFYGIAFIVELARRLGDVRFELLATTISSGLPPNVRTLGWVEDMDSVFRRAAVLVRPVMHDGLANMVIEALAYGRYVLWSYEMRGVETITTLDAAEKYIRELAEKSLDLARFGRTSSVEHWLRTSTICPWWSL